MSDTEIQALMKKHEERNMTLIEQLRARGVNLEETRSIELHFWASTRQDAAFLARALYEKGYLVLALAPSNAESKKQQWNVEVGIRQSIKQTVRKELVEELVRLADRHSSEFDGWGTSL